MRRIIHNTTALAAGLALLLPQIAAAELRITDEVANTEAQPRAEAMPFLANVLQVELADGLAVDGLVCLNGDPRPCGDDVRLATPKGVVVEVSESDSIILAPVPQQVNRADAEGNVMPRDGAQAPEVAQAEPAPEMAPEPEAEVQADAEAQADAIVEAEAVAADEAQVEAEAVAATDSADAPQTKAEEKEAKKEEKAEQKAAKQQEKAEEKQAKAENKQPQPAEPAQQAAEAEVNAEQAEDALAEALAAAQQEAQPEAQPEQAEQPKQASGKLTLAQGENARARLENMPGLASVLRQELDAGLSKEQLVCQTGDVPPCAEGVALMTPRGVGVIINNEDSVALLAADRQINRVNAQGEILPRAPEENTVETAAAKEAAKETAAPAAAALDAAEGAGEVVAEQQVTEENTRSSAQDFETSLRNALQQVGQQTGTTAQQPANAAADDGGDDNDLAKALILGLGAVAVGQMLNNNRQVALSTDDRVVVTRTDGSQEVIKDEVALLRQPGSTVTTENFDDGSSRTIVTREDGSKVVTIRDADLRVLRRTLISADGKTTMLIDDTADVQPVDVASLPAPAEVQTTSGALSEDELRAALQREAAIDRRFTLGQIRNIPEVRALVAPVNIDAITFDTGSAAINPDQARQLAGLGRVIQDAIARNPQEIFMIEGHTDTVGADAMNLALSDRRAESVALALSEYFDVPPENMVVQGYGEQFLKVRSEGDIRANRRASVRRITDLLQTAQAN